MDGVKAASGARRSGRGKDSLRVWLRLLSCERLMEQRLRGRLREKFAITLPQFDVLAELERAEQPLTMSQLSIELMVSNGNITGVVDRLERDGQVRRTRCNEDRRVQHIALTKKGASAFKAMAAWHEVWVQEFFSELTQAELRALQALLLKARQSGEIRA